MSCRPFFEPTPPCFELAPGSLDGLTGRSVNSRRALRKTRVFLIFKGNRLKNVTMLVSHAAEMAAARELIEAEMATVFDEQGDTIDIPIGTMIEVPRAALTAAQIAEHADFFSFGTNDLTQMTMGISRDDAEASFLLAYQSRGIVGANPFHTIDVDGVGRLMELAVTEGRAASPDLQIGICGEHGGEPASIALCQKLGLDYVSCSAYRVPVARLAAAHAALAAVSSGSGR